MERDSFIALLASAAVPPAAPGNAVRIAALGDSLALGTGAVRADGGFIFRTYRAILAQRPGSRIDTFAIGGSTAADVLRLQAGRLRNDEAGVVIVCAGANDVVRDTPAAAFRHAYVTLLARIGQVAPRARIVCCGVPDLGVSPIFGSERAAVAARSARDDRIVRAAARAARASFVDLYAVTHGQRNAARFLSHDRFHPSDDGYALLAAALRPVVERALGPD